MAGKPKPRYWKLDEIEVLPKELRDEFFGQNTSGWKFKKKTELSKNEQKSLAPILKNHKFTEIWRIPEVSAPSHIHAPDLWIDRIKTEIKSVTTAGSIQSQIRSASKQVGEAGQIILDVSGSQLSKQKLFSEISQKLNRYSKSPISAGIVKGNSIIGTISKSPAQSAKGAEGRDFYEMIISRSPQKVNKKPKLHTQIRTYWQKRSIERTLESERQSLPYLRQSRRVYAKSARAATKQVQDIYIKYYKDNGFDMQALRGLAPQGDVRRLKARMRKIGLETKLPDNYAARVNRLEMLNLQMRAEAYEAGQKINQITGKSLAKTYENGYYRTIYDTAKGIGHTPAFSQLDKETVSKVLDAKNYGKNFSERIWRRSEKLGDELQEIVGTAIATGQSSSKVAQLLRERFDVSKSAAERLIRTETNYFENQAELAAYKEMGVEEYQFVATIDTRTSEICQHLDHKIFKIKDAKAGENIPPCHPNCRSTIVPYFGKEWEPEARIARNPETGKNEYIANMSYREWQNAFIKTEPSTKSDLKLLSLGAPTEQDDFMSVMGDDAEYYQVKGEKEARYKEKLNIYSDKFPDKLDGISLSGAEKYLLGSYDSFPGSYSATARMLNNIDSILSSEKGFINHVHKDFIKNNYKVLANLSDKMRLNQKPRGTLFRIEKIDTQEYKKGETINFNFVSTSKSKDIFKREGEYITTRMFENSNSYFVMEFNGDTIGGIDVSKYITIKNQQEIIVSDKFEVASVEKIPRIKNESGRAVSRYGDMETMGDIFKVVFKKL